MKWFKHMSDPSRDEDVVRMMDESGRDQLAVYGFFNVAMEHIVEKMKPGKPNNGSVTYSAARWARIVGTNKQRVRGLMEKLSTNRALTVEVIEDTYTVTVPYLLDWADDYFKKSGHTPDKVAQKREEKNRTEKRESKDEGTLSESLAAGGARLSPPPDFKVTESLQEWATKNYSSVDINKSTSKFLRHEFPKPRSNWDAVWQTWIQREAEYQQKHNGSSAKPSRNVELLALGKELGVEKQSDESEAQYCDRVESINQRRVESQDL